MFSNNSDNSQLDKENKNADDATLFNELTFANISIIYNMVDHRNIKTQGITTVISLLYRAR